MLKFVWVESCTKALKQPLNITLNWKSRPVSGKLVTVFWNSWSAMYCMFFWVDTRLWIPSLRGQGHFHFAKGPCIEKSMGNFWGGTKAKTRAIEAIYSVMPDTSRRQQRQLSPCSLVVALVPLKCSSRNLLPHMVPFTKEKMHVPLQKTEEKNVNLPIT